MKKMLFVVKPKAGKKVIKNRVYQIINIFSHAGYNVEYHPTKSANDAAEYVEKHGTDYDMIVCAGGDGTLDNTVTGLMGLRRKGLEIPPLGYIPCGSTNDFAKSLKISSDPVQAAKDIVRGTPCPIDVGIFGKENFIYVVAFGIFTDISYSTSQKLKNKLGHSAYIISAFKELARVKPVKLAARIDGKVISGEFLYGQITNSRSVGGFRAIGVKDMSFSDGKFECLFIKKPKNPLELAKILTAIATNKMNPKLMYKCNAKEVVIVGKEPIPWTKDGEYGGTFKKIKTTNGHKAISIVLNDKSAYNKGI